MIAVSGSERSLLLFLYFFYFQPKWCKLFKAYDKIVFIKYSKNYYSKTKKIGLFYYTSILLKVHV